MVLMHCCTIVEVYFSNWVMHQFGLHQHIVDGVDTLVDLYVVNHRGIMDDDWSVVHIEYVNLWHARRYYILT
jgi:hypothetical protein